MVEKTLDELHREQADAAAQLESILNSTRPKGFKEGMTSGVNNIVQGAVGAAGFAVLAPTMGLTVGVREGGLIGGIVGVTGGAVAGVLGAAAMAVGGAVTGVVQIGRGIVATPQSIIAPRQGKWWNEYAGKWVLTNLPEEEVKVLKGVPDDDKDILGTFEDEIDDSVRFEVSTRIVKEMYYYDVLDLPASADASAIKRRYYVLARQYHPDKVGPDNKEAAEKFKKISEAYQVLSDPDLRARYDKEGRQGLSPDKTSVAGSATPQIDPSILFAFLFGSDKFTDYIGQLSTATSALVGDTQKISVTTARKLQRRRVTRLALKLASKITPWVEESKEANKILPNSAFAAEWRREAEELSKASYGHQLVTTIGKIYNLVGIMYEGSVETGQGLPTLSKWAARQQALLEKKKVRNENEMDAVKAGMDMMNIRSDLQKRLADAQSDAEEQAIIKEAEEASTMIMLRLMWTTTVVDISSVIHETSKMVFYDQSVEKETRKYRALVVKTIGQIWMDCPAPAKADGEAEKGPAQLFEEAAFAAMIETIHRKDEAN